MLKDKELTSLHDSLFAKFKNYALSKEQMRQVRGGKGSESTITGLRQDGSMSYYDTGYVGDPYHQEDVLYSSQDDEGWIDEWTELYLKD